MSRAPRSDSPLAPISRRHLLRRGGAATLSASALALLAGAPGLARAEARSGPGPRDITILNGALASEHEAVAAYGAGLESGLLQADVAKLAGTFRDQHREHADLLAATVKKLGGTPRAPKERYDLPLGQLTSQEDVLRLAADLERGAVSAYLGAVPILGSGELAKAAASILGDEAMHWAVLRYALGEDPVPSAFVA